MIEDFIWAQKKYGENLQFHFVLSQENGLVKGLQDLQKKSLMFFSILDKSKFGMEFKNVDALGFIKISLHEISKKDDNLFLFELIKSSYQNFCLKCLPPWQKNFQIFKDVEILLTQKIMNFV